MVVGAEWADRVSPYAGFRAVDPEDNRCWVCDMPDTACTHSTYRVQTLGRAERVDAGRIVMARAAAQTARPTVSAKTTRGAAPGVSQDQASTIPPVPPQAPAEGAQINAEAPADVVATDRAPVTAGDRLDQMQLSPIAPDGGAQMPMPQPLTLVEGDPSQYRDVLTEPVPEGKIDAATDPQRPRHKGVQGVLVSEEWQWGETGAWTTDPTNSRMVLLTRDVHRVLYVDHMTEPIYRLVARRFTRFPRPGVSAR